MVLTTLFYGILVTALGVIGYFATGQVSKTALIPCVFGLPIICLAIAEWFRPKISKQTSIAALVIAILALFGTAKGFSGLATLLRGGEVARPTATIVQAIMAATSVGYILLGSNSLFKSKK